MSISRHHVAAGRRWLAFARLQGCRFSADVQLAKCLGFVAQVGARSFVVPSALEGVAAIGPQERLQLLAGELRVERRPVRLRLKLLRGDGGDEVAVLSGSGPVGYLRRKHVAWVRPLLHHGLQVYALRVTGGTEDKPTRGLNVVIAGIEQALDAYEAAQEERRRTQQLVHSVLNSRPAISPKGTPRGAIAETREGYLASLRWPQRPAAA